MILAHPLWLLILVLLPVPWLIARRKGYVGHPDTRLFGSLGGARFLHLIPLVLLVAGFVALGIALARPQKLHVLSVESFKSRDIIIGVDFSGSMGTSFGKIPPSVIGETELDKDFPGRPDRQNGQARDAYGYPVKVGERRIDAAQAATLDFIRDRYVAKAGDRVGIFVFDTDQYWHWPLTHDLKMIYRKVHFADEGGLGGGTNFGNMKPGPLDAAAEHFDEMGKANTRVLIMVTDGEDRLYGDAYSRLKDLAASYNLKLYVILVASDAHSDIIALAEDTGGKGFRADNPADLKDCFNTIDKMEQSQVTVDTAENREELFYYFAGAALLLLLLGTLGEALILNR